MTVPFVPEAARRQFLRRVAGPALGWVVLGWATGCAQLAGPRSVVYREAELQALLAKRFPLDRRLLEVLEVRVTEPRVGLLPDQGRLWAELDVALTDRLFGGHYDGRLSLTTALQVDADSRSLRMKDVRVSRLTWDSRGQPTAERVQRLGTVLAERVLEGMTLHSFRPEQWDRLMAAGYSAPTVHITSSGLEVRAVPAR